MVVQSSLATASHDSKGCVCVCVCHVSAASFPISPLCEPLMTVSCKIRVHFSFFVHIFRPCFRSVMYSSSHTHVHTLTFTHSRSHTHVHTHIHTHVHHVKRPAHQKLKPFAHTDERRPDFGVSLSHQSAASVPLSQLICIVCVSVCQSGGGSPQSQRPAELSDDEVGELFQRLAEVQQEKWMLEEKVRRLLLLRQPCVRPP